MMRNSLRAAALAATISGWAICQADVTFSRPYDPWNTFYGLSAITNPAAGQWSPGADYLVDFRHSGSDSFYINGFSIEGDTGPLTLFDTSLSYYDNNDPDTTPGAPYYSRTYNLGTAITGDQSWRFGRLAFIDDPTGLEAATYNFTMSFIGGATDTAEDVLQQYTCELAVIPTLDITVEGAVDPSSITAGQTSHLLMSVTNNMSDFAFVSTTWYTSGFSSGSGNLNLAGFDFGTDGVNWFNQTIDSGGNLTLGHTFWSADSTTAAGVYSGGNGVVGGIYNGDGHLISMSNDPTITVNAVPEPMTMSVLGIGSLLLAIRRRRRK